MQALAAVINVICGSFQHKSACGFAMPHYRRKTPAISELFCIAQMCEYSKSLKTNVQYKTGFLSPKRAVNRFAAGRRQGYIEGPNLIRC